MRLLQTSSWPLRWKLTLSYTMVTVAALLVVEFAIIAVILFAINSERKSPAIMHELDEDIVPEAGMTLESSPDALSELEEGLRGYLARRRERFTLGFSENERLIMFSPQREVLLDVSAPRDRHSSPPRIDLAAIPGLNTLLAEAQRGNAAFHRQASDLSRTGELLTVAVPINSSTGELHALLAYVAASPPYVAYFISTILVVVVILVGFTLAAGGVGSIFGFLTARLISSRLQSLTHTADAWSQGDFSATAHDPSADELGQLAQQLNRMAEQLQRLFQTRQALAMLEERNLLARDLHDSVKQQIFAATMQVGAAQDLMERNPQAAQSSLNEAVRLGRQAQQELTALIRELRPAALQDQDLAAALQRYIDDWSRQTQIQAQFHPQATRPLPFMLEQTFFRVAQEALSNIARHSQASTVTVKLDATAQHATLAITDDGQGFDPATTRHSGVGLASMRERVEALGGSLLVQSAPGDGTAVIVRFDGDGFAQHIREDTKYERSAHSSDR